MTQATTITCPSCNEQIQLDSALAGQFQKTVEAEVRKRLAEPEKQLNAEREKLAAQAKELEAARVSLEERVAAQVRAQRQELEAREKALQSRQNELDAQIEARVRERETQLTAENQKRLEEIETAAQKRADEAEAQARKRAEEAETRARQQVEEAAQRLRKQIEEDYAYKLKAAQEDLEAKRRQVAELEKQEMELRREKTELEEARQRMELDMQRKLDEERGRIFEEAKKSAADEQMLKVRDKDNLIDRLKAQLQDAQRRIEQGSQERQGEALEGEVIDLLRQNFPYDQFDEIGRGVRGADILQTVRNSVGRTCGKILWESKNTKTFDKNWLPKLKDDQHKAGADVSVLVSMTMPDGVDVFDLMDEIWVTNFRSSVCLCSVLRQMILNVDRQRVISNSQSSMRDSIYEYVTGKEFTSYLKRVFMTYESMHSDLEKEKRAIQRIWKQRETSIQKVLDSITCIQGDLRAIVGQSKELPAFEPLQLEVIAGNGFESEDEEEEGE